MSKPIVSVIMGSDSDRSAMNEALSVLDDFGLPHETKVLSAHRTPDALRDHILGIEERGPEVIIAGAGKAAHLAGAAASLTVIPVIGVPLYSKDFGGLDALLSTVQMPGGVPVATVAVNGAKNAALLAVSMLGLKYPEVQQKLRVYRDQLAQKAASRNQ